MTPDEQKELHRGRRLASKSIIEEQARRQVRTFLDELKNGTRNYRTVASLGSQVAQEYRGRAILELLQNAHDVLVFAEDDDPRQISFVLRSSPDAELLVANSGRPFRREDFSGICQLAQSPKDPNESVGNKGLGFQSVLEVSTRPEVWSTAPAGDGIAFTFGFDPDVCEPIERVARALLTGNPPTDPEFGTEPVVDWSPEQIEEYRRRLDEDGINPMHEVCDYLSPYVIPRFLGDPPPEVARLLEDGHVTVIRLPLDGGRVGRAEEAVDSVRKQLEELDEAAVVFLPDLSVLRIEMEEDRVELKRRVEVERTYRPLGTNLSHGDFPEVRHTRLRVGRTGRDAVAERSFHVWSRVLGGDDQREATNRIAAAVRHLPNRWPEVEKVEVSVSVEETREARRGALVIFLPTTMKTGIGAHVNAPFYGSLDRKTIDFGDEYNDLMLEFVTDLALDAVLELVKGPAEPWRGRAVIDLLAQVGSPPSDDPELMRRLRERARDRDDCPALEQEALILCDGGWRQPGVARTMPTIPSDDPLGEGDWRKYAGFAVASSALDERRDPVEALLGSLGGSPVPQNEEWARTLERMAGLVGRLQADAQADPSRALEAPPDWDVFLSSVLAVLPPELRAEPKEPDSDPLAGARFLPTEDGRLLSASDAVRMFFQPRQGADDAADFVASVPASLKERIAFLHHDVQTHEGPQRRRTAVQKFLDSRFVQSFRREDLLREVVIPSLPGLPATHGSAEAAQCADALAWTLEVIGEEEPESLLDRLADLPVACTGGWFPLKEAVFGPGWPGRSGDHLQALASGLSAEEGAQLLRSALLPPDDDRWSPGADKRGVDDGDEDGTDLENRAELFARAGVVSGLRLEACEPIRFKMSRSHPNLPDTSPGSIPQSAWDDWKQAALGQVKPHWKGWFEHELQDVTVLPILHREDIGDSAQTALSNLLLASLSHWKPGWEKVTIRRTWWSQRIPSPLKHWLSTLPWLDDSHHGSQGHGEGPRPLRQRWLVPGSLLRGQSGRFRHLSPLALPVAQQLGDDAEMVEVLEGLGLNVFPTEEARTGPALLETLADVAERLAQGRRVRSATPAGGFDVLLGQIRHGWRHLDPEGDLPTRFIIRTTPRTLTVRTRDELKDVYLPDHSWNTRLLREHGQPIVAMRPEEASKKPLRDRLVELGARRAAGLEEHCRIDHAPSTQAVDGTQTLDAAGLDWLPVVLLALHAHGGGNPAGPATKAWLEAAARLRRARVRQCSSIKVELLDAGRGVAHSEPRAHWLSRDRVLVLHRDITQGGRYEEIAAASQAILDRQDLLKDLRLVLGALPRIPRPTRSQIEAALDRAEIDAVAVTDIRYRWDVGTSTLVRRIRPVLQLHGVSQRGLDDAAKNTSSLTRWLSRNVRIDGWPTEELLATARESYDDFEMGYRTWQVLGDAFELREWNKALGTLGGQYKQVINTQAEAQARRSLYEAGGLLRAFAQHVATAEGGESTEDQGKLFSKLAKVHGDLETDPEWPSLCDQWSRDLWKVPFGEVLGVLRAGYEGMEEAKPHLGVFEHVTSINELRLALEQQEVALEPDPIEVARDNQYRLDKAVRGMRRLYECWIEKEGGEPKSGPEAPEVRLEDSMYLRKWPEDDLFERAKQAVDDSGFHAAVAGCDTFEAMRKRLGITSTPPSVKRTRPEPMRDVAGVSEPINSSDTNYRDIFERLKKLPEPPKAANGIVRPPTGPDRGRGEPRRRNNEVGEKGSKTAHLYGSPHLPEFVGIIGEMQAFRLLKDSFGINESAWVSEFRRRIVPLLDGEKDETSDSHGYDFRFEHDGKTWCVEVKATTGDGTSFDLPASELNAASRIASRREEVWRILRVRRALSGRPECDWLPNPFEPGAGERLRLRQGGVTVEYERSVEMGNTVRRDADDSAEDQRAT